MNKSAINTALASCGLFLLTLVSHRFFRPVAPSLVSSDFGAFHLNTEELLHGHLPFFMLQQSYGGTLLVNLIRLLFLKCAWAMGFGVTPAAELDLLSAFTFIVIPFLLSLAAFFSIRKVARFSSAWIVAASIAMGWNYLLRELYGNDYYFSYVVMGLFLLPFRKSCENPLLDLDKKKLALAALITGYGIYSCRAFMVIAVAFWTPWRLLPKYLSSVFRFHLPKGQAFGIQLASLLRIPGYLLLALGAYLFVFGENLGEIRGHSVKLLALPNFKWAVLCFLPYFGLLHFHDFPFKTQSLRIVRFAGFALLGFLPEIVHHLLRKETGILNPTFFHDFHGMMSILTQFPEALKTLVSASPTRLDSLLYVGLALAASGMLVTLAVKRKADFDAYLGSFAFGIIAFILIRTYEGPAPVRYLFPILPALWFGIAFLLDRSSPKTRVALIVLILGVLGPLQIMERRSFAQQLARENTRDTMSEVIETFRAEKLPLVISDSYLFSNQFTAAARSHPVFIGPKRWIESYQGTPLAQALCEIGVMSQSDLSSQPAVTLRDKTYSLRFIRAIGEFRLYRAFRSGC